MSSIQQDTLNPSTNEPNGEEDLFFAEETEEVENDESLPTWKVLIADDEDDVHTVTKHALYGFSFMGRKLQFMDAYSGDEAIKLLARNPDTAVVLLDVVMKHESDGLSAVKRIRNELDNSLVRIILRTGQPGQAPENNVIVNYDINDYRSKTELTAQKMFSAMVAALRSYHDLKSIESNRHSLQKILDASSQYNLASMRTFVSGLLSLLANQLELTENDIILVQHSEEDNELQLIAAAGMYESFIGKSAKEVLDSDVFDAMAESLENQTNINKSNYNIYLVPDNHQGDVAIYVYGAPLEEIDLDLVRIFCEKVLLAYDNSNLLKDSQSDLDVGLSALSKLANPSYSDPEAHAKQVGKLSADIAISMVRLKQTEILPRNIRKQLAQAAMLCDLGNLNLPSSLWENTGTLSAAEHALIQTHPTQGIAFLEKLMTNKRSGVFFLSQKIMLSHHERYDGSGYPNALTGKEIPLAGRIVAIADTFISLRTARPHRDAYSHSDAVEIIRNGANALFDPEVVTAFIKIVDEHHNVG